MRKKSLASLTHALRVGDGIGADGVVLHPGARKDDTADEARKRAIKPDQGGAGAIGELPDPLREHRRARRSSSAATSTSRPS